MLASMFKIAAALGLGAAIALVGTAAARGETTARCRVVHHKRVCAKAKPKSPAPAAVVAKIAVGGRIFDIVDGFGSIWARVGTDSAGGTVVRIDPVTNAVVARIPVPEGLHLAVGDNAVWAANGSDNTLSRIDPVTNAVVATIPLPDVEAAAVAVTAEDVWVGTQGAVGKPGLLVRVSAATNTVVGSTALPGASGAFDMVATGGTLWIVTDAELLRTDAATLATSEIAVLANQDVCGRIATDGANVWVAGGNCGFPRFPLAGVATATGKIFTEPRLPPTSDVSVGAGGVWASTASGGLVRVDGATGKVVGSMSVGTSPGPAAIDAAVGAVWVGGADGMLERLAPR